MAELIYQTIANVMEDVTVLAKEERNQQQGWMFRGIDSLLNVVGPALRKHKLVVVPRLLDQQLETFVTRQGAPVRECTLRVEYTFIAEDGSKLAAEVSASCWDSGDKAVPKAWSVALRTALLQVLCIPTGEPDPDTYTYEMGDDINVDDQPSPKPAPAANGKKKAAVDKKTIAFLKNVVLEYLPDVQEASSWWAENSTRVLESDDPETAIRVSFDK